MDKEFYVEKNYTHEFEIKKSKFISILTPFEKFDYMLNKLKKEHKKASHIVWAYRFYKNNVVYEKCTDNKEPQNSAGKPTLNAIIKSNLINCSIFTIRYFGGILLGKGGLSRAYSSSALGVINVSDLKIFDNAENFKLNIKYKNLEYFEYTAKKQNIKILKKEFCNDSVKFEILVNKKIYEEISKTFPLFHK